MIASIKRSPQDTVPEWHNCLLQMLPQIRRYARYAFRRLAAEERQEAIAEVIAACTVAVARLAQRDRLSLAHPTPLTWFAVKRYFSGRRVGNKIASRDVYSQQARDKGGYELRHIGTPHERQAGDWREQLTENRRTTPADLACFRLDFPCWLATYPDRDRLAIELLGRGHSTGEVASRVGVTSSRISQLRRRFRDDWAAFQHANPPSPAGRPTSGR